MKKVLAAATLTAGLVLAVPTVASAAPADGKCVAKGAGFTFDGPTKASVARGELPVGMSFVIKDHVFNGANATEGLLGVTICA